MYNKYSEADVQDYQIIGGLIGYDNQHVYNSVDIVEHQYILALTRLEAQCVSFDPFATYILCIGLYLYKYMYVLFDVVYTHFQIPVVKYL